MNKHIKKNLLTLGLLLGFTTTTLYAQAPGGAPETNLSLWLKANDGVVGGASVTQWQDQSGKGRHFSSLGIVNPSSTANRMNFNPVVTYTSSNNKLGRTGDAINTYTSNMNTGINDSGVISFFSVTKQNGDGLVFNQYNGTANAVINVNKTSGLLRAGLRSGFSATLTPPNNVPLVTSFTAIPGVNNSRLSINSGIISAGSTLSRDVNSPHPTALGGWANDPSSNFLGDFAEIITFNKEVTVLEKDRIESYLALKYGITLDQTTELSYLASDGNPMWDATGTGTSGYNNDIFGVGRDDASGLDQRISTSQETDDILTVSLDDDFTSANNDPGRTTPFSADMSFLTFSNNDGAVNTWSSTDMPCVCKGAERIPRTWIAQETGTVGSVWLAFNADSLMVPPDSKGVYLLVANLSTGNAFTYHELMFDDLGDADTSNDVYKINIDLGDSDVLFPAYYKDVPRMRHGKQRLFDRENPSLYRE